MKRATHSLLSLLTHPGHDVQLQGVELARTRDATERQALISSLLSREDPWLCFAVAGQQPDADARRLALHCLKPALSKLPMSKPYRVLLRRLADLLTAHPTCDPFEHIENLRGEIDALPRGPLIEEEAYRIVLALRSPPRDCARLSVEVAQRFAMWKAKQAAELRAEEARESLWQRSRDARMARNVYNVSQRDSRLSLESVLQDTTVELQTELFRRCMDRLQAGD